MLILEKAAADLNLPLKKVYKWGYDRKHVSRNLGDFNTSKANDYNIMVDEILMLKSKELNLAKRKYNRKEPRFSQSKSTTKSDTAKIIKNVGLKLNLTSVEEFSDWELQNLVNDTSIGFEGTLSPVWHKDEVDVGCPGITIPGEKPMTANFRESFWNQENNFLGNEKNLGFEISTSSPYSGDQRQLDNIWSTTTTDLNVTGYF